MNFEKIGRFLVYVQVCFGILALGWALMLYLNHVDWAAIVKQKSERIKDLGNALQASEARVQGPRTRMNADETRRPRDRTWYENQLKFAEGNKGPVPVPVLKDGRAVEDPKTSQMQMQQGTDRKGRPLFGMARYQNEILQKRQAIEREQQRLKAAVEEETKLAQKVVGERGLQQRIFDEQVRLASVGAEIRDLEPRQGNADVDTELLLQRQKQLEERVAELERTKAARR